MIKGIIFDFDGTIFNTNDLIKDSFRYTLKKEMNHQVTEEELLQVWGQPLDQQMKFFSFERVDKLVKTYRDYYHKHSRGIKPFPGAVEVINKAHSLGYKTAILTNKSTRGLTHGLELYELSEIIDYYLSKENLAEGKPAPEGFYRIMRRLNLDSNEVLMIGDSPSDIIGGQNASVKTVLVSYTYFDLNEMMALKPDHVIDNLNEIFAIILNYEKEERGIV